LKTNKTDYMLKKSIVGLVILGVAIYISSCYNNKSDIVGLPKVSFMGEVVPIITSSGCGCHSNVNANTPPNNNAFPFVRFDTIFDGTTIQKINRTVFYDGIIARVDTFKLWSNGVIGHPGGGAVDLTPTQRTVIKKWIAQGPPYDGGGAGCVAGTNTKYTTDILPIYNTTCKSAGCHEGRGPVLTYSKLVADKTILTTMMASAGSSGHPGGVIGLSSCIVTKFQAWIAAGQPN
jgi:hypothetical protein